MTQIAHLVPQASVPNIPVTNIDNTCAKYFEEEISKIHHYSQPHNTEFIEQVSVKFKDYIQNKIGNLLFLLYILKNCPQKIS